jgi:site-specific DNA-methyltransferase (adenine-specific)
MTNPVRIGDAELWLGDAREILPSFPDASVDFIFTDPPYGHNNNNNGDLIAKWEQALGRGTPGEARPIHNDGPEANELVRWFFGEAKRLLARGGCCCCCGGGGGPDPQFARWSLWLDEIIGFKQMVVWDKGPMGMGWHYRRSYETVLVGEKPGGPCNWNDTSGAIENIIRPGQYGIRKIIPQADQHPTAKPIELAAHFIRLHSTPGEFILDPFMGHASTAVAARLLGRKFIGIESDPAHFEAAIVRLERAQRQPDMFIERPKPAKQEVLL